MNDLELLSISNFLPELAALLPDTHRLLSSANLVIHPLVSRVVLHGSRGLAGGWCPDSDIQDLSLLVETPDIQISHTLFYDITRRTLDNWRSPIEVDLAVIYDTKKAGWNASSKPPGARTCVESGERTASACTKSKKDLTGL